jgi:hypothetical protein
MGGGLALGMRCLPMAQLRLYFTGEPIGEKLKRSTEKNTSQVISAMMETGQQTADTIVARGRANIAGAGKFGSRWTTGLQAKVTRGGGNIRLAVTHSEKYFRVFERGATIAGKPLLWLPVGGGGSGGSAGQVYAQNFPGRLFKITSKKGRPLLMDAVNKTPRYVGLGSVRVPRKFHIRDIIREEATKMKALYKQKFATGGSGASSTAR